MPGVKYGDLYELTLFTIYKPFGPPSLSGHRSEERWDRLPCPQQKCWASAVRSVMPAYVYYPDPIYPILSHVISHPPKMQFPCVIFIMVGSPNWIDAVCESIQNQDPRSFPGSIYVPIQPAPRSPSAIPFACSEVWFHQGMAGASPQRVPRARPSCPTILTSTR